MTATSPEEALEAARQWLLFSGIQNTEGDLAGSFNAWYDGGYPFAHSEVTGYAITLLCHLHRLHGGPAYLEKARHAADWLLENARHGPVFLCRRYPATGWLKHLCTFDNGMVINGLCNLYGITARDEYLQAATAAADWLLAKMRHPEGFFVAKWDLDRNKPVAADRWSTRWGPYQAKVAQALLHLKRFDDKKEYGDAAVKVCSWARSLQQPDGRFVTDVVEGDTYLHPHCYAAEGLVAAANLGGHAEFLRPADRAVAWMRSALLPNGGLPRRFDGTRFEGNENVDSTAQALRLSILLDHQFGEARRLATRLLEFQCWDDDPAKRGGFFYGTEGGAMARNVTAHGTFFALQALELYTRGDRGFELAQLV